MNPNKYTKSEKGIVMTKLSFKEYSIKAGEYEPLPISGDGSLLKEMLNGVIPGTASPTILGPLRVNQGRTMLRRNWYGEPIEGEEDEQGTASKIDQARTIFQNMARNPGTSRQQIIDSMMKYAQVTHSTAVSYYERLAKEAGMTNQGADDQGANPMQAAASDDPMGGGAGGSYGGDPMAMGQQPLEDPELDPEQQERPEVEFTYPDDPNRQGVIRHVDKAHLVYKRQTGDGTFDELWVYNISSDMKDELKIRRNILSGTDIPAHKTSSPDGTQSYTLTTLGNGQIVHITGLPQ